MNYQWTKEESEYTIECTLHGEAFVEVKIKADGENMANLLKVMNLLCCPPAVVVNVKG